jgi:hypothetical protein
VDETTDINARSFLLHATLQREKVPSFDASPFNLPAVRNLDQLQFNPRVTFLVGENGSGKSTLLEALAVAAGFNAEGGSKNFRFETRASHSDLHRYVRLSRSHKRPQTGFFLRAESFFNVATEVDRLDKIGAPLIGSYGGKSLHEQSHGESFMALLRIVLVPMASTSWMNPKPLFLPRVRWPRSFACTISSKKDVSSSWLHTRPFSWRSLERRFWASAPTACPSSRTSRLNTTRLPVVFLATRLAWSPSFFRIRNL